MHEITIQNKLGFRAVFHIDLEKALDTILTYYSRMKTVSLGKQLLQNQFNILQLAVCQVAQYIFNGPHIQAPTVETVKANAPYQDQLPALDGSTGINLVELIVPEAALCDFSIDEIKEEGVS